jgi:type II pantothenate kinase
LFYVPRLEQVRSCRADHGTASGILEENMRAAIDFGLTNVDVVVSENIDVESITRSAMVPSERKVDVTQLARALKAVGHRVVDFDRICVTGGQHRKLPNNVDGVPVVKVGEVEAIGWGGVALARRERPELDAALVVSAGSGTAMVAVRGGVCYHATGSAVGGGTLLGLCRLLIGTSDPREIDELAMRGDPNQVDLTLVEATGGAIGRLPADANAVNFGRVPSLTSLRDLSRQDLAAGVALLVGQVIAVIAINAARAEQIDQVVMTGHTVDLACMRRVLSTVAGYYDARIMVPAMPGFATAVGALLH